jgi:hypothetical protein
LFSLSPDSSLASAAASEPETIGAMVNATPSLAAIANGGQTDNLYQEPPGLGAMQSAEVPGTVPAAADAACRDSW